MSLNLATAMLATPTVGWAEAQQISGLLLAATTAPQTLTLEYSSLVGAVEVRTWGTAELAEDLPAVAVSATARRAQAAREAAKLLAALNTTAETLTATHGAAWDIVDTTVTALAEAGTTEVEALIRAAAGADPLM